jgi:hypothetical protein
LFIPPPKNEKKKKKKKKKKTASRQFFALCCYVFVEVFVRVAKFALETGSKAGFPRRRSKSNSPFGAVLQSESDVVARKKKKQMEIGPRRPICPPLLAVESTQSRKEGGGSVVE